MRARACGLGSIAAIAAIFLASAPAWTQMLSAADQPAPPLKVAQLKPGVRAPTAASIGEGQLVTKVNSWTVGLASGLPEGTFIRFGAEIARNLNDGDELRVIPMITYGATDNVKDLLYLRGVDVAFTNADVLEHFRTVEKIPNIDRRINFITGMYIGHVHLLVRADIGSLQDLAGKKVSFHTPGAGASVSAPILFQRLGIKVEPVYVNNAIALEQMKTGEVAGLVNTGGKPQDLFTKFKNDYGYKFLSVPFDKFDDLYVPSTFTSDDYPGYIKPGEKIEALGVPVVLAVYNWPKENDRFRRVQRFIEYFFDRFEGFQKAPYHPAWKSINLASKVPGWTRYWVAEERLRAIAAAKPDPSRPVDHQLARQQAARVAPNNSAEQERLFQQFLEWSRTQGKR
jgi:TRAP-type uncharacterized transport system substrate-binding protein